MSIKSEKAKADVELLKRQLTYCELNDVRFGVEDHKESRAYRIGKDIESYVVQAESDARDRAVRAFCVLCRNEGGCPDIHHMTGQEMLNCNYVNDFLKHYNNDR